DTPNQGSTCVKGRFGYDFPQHHDRLTKPLIRKGWEKEQGRWVWRGRSGANRRSGPWQTIEGEGQNPKPAGPPRSVGKAVRDLPLLERVDLDIRDRVATPPSWYEPFREATWDEALELTAQELLRLKGERGPASLACFSSAKCSNEENYLMMRMFRAALGTNNIDHCTRLCHSTSVAAMQRALNTSAASGSMREVEHAADVIFIAGANTTESHPVFGAAIKRAHERGATLIVADPRKTELPARAQHQHPVGDGPHPTRQRHRPRHLAPQPDARLRHDRSLGRGDDARARPEQRAGRFGRRGDPLRVHRLPLREGSQHQGGIRQGVGRARGVSLAQGGAHGHGDRERGERGSRDVHHG